MKPTIECEVEKKEFSKYDKYLLWFTGLFSYIVGLFYSGCFNFLAQKELFKLLHLLLPIFLLCVLVIHGYILFIKSSKEIIKASVISSWREKQGKFLKMKNLKWILLFYISFILLVACSKDPVIAIVVIAILFIFSFILLIDYFYRFDVFVCEEGIAIEKIWNTKKLTKWSSFNSYKIFEKERFIELKTKSGEIFVLVPHREDFSMIKEIISERLHKV